MTTEDYGITSVASSFSLTMGFVVSLSLFSAIMRFYVDLKDDPKKLARFYGTVVVFSMLSSVVWALLMTVLRAPLSQYVFSGVDYYPVIALCLITLVFNVQHTIYTNILRSQQKAMQSSVLSIAYFFLTLALNMLFVVVLKKGADLVVCQHSHCIGCEETYQNGTIVYGQGNFLFDRSQSEHWHAGLLLQVEDGRVSYIPLVKTDNTVRLAQGQAAQDILAAFRSRSEEILSPHAVEQNYDAFARQLRQRYMAALGGVNTRGLLFRIANRLTGGRFQSWYLDKKIYQGKMPDPAQLYRM